MKSDLTVEILKDIRTGVQATNARLEETNARLEETNARIDQTNAAVVELREELSRRIVDSEIRTSTAITESAGTVREVASLLRQQHDLRPRVEKCESDIAELKRRVSNA